MKQCCSRQAPAVGRTTPAPPGRTSASSAESPPRVQRGCARARASRTFSYPEFPHWARDQYVY
eukprot:7547055-Pyramimonas_sp.AAC.1